MNTVKAFIERDDDGTYSVYVDLDDNSLNYGIYGDGNTVEEAIEDFKLSYEGMKEIYKKDGKHFVEANFSFAYDLTSFLEYYSKTFTYSALERLTGVNQTQLSQYVQGYRKPSKKTTQKIETALHNFAQELSQVQFV